MKLASHNSLTYLKPKYWFMCLFQWLYRCQSKTIDEQYAAGVRYFDFRISFDRQGMAHFRHGLVVFKASEKDIHKILENLNTHKDVVVRFVLEWSSSIEDKYLFITLCKEVQEAYKNIKFTSGEYIKTKEILYDFGTQIKNPVHERYSSVVGSKLNGLWPWRFAKKNNEKYLEEFKGKRCYLMLDFI